MKYLLPLITSTQLKNESKDFYPEKNDINNITLNFHPLKKEIINNKNINKIAICKNLLFGRIKNRKKYKKNNSIKNLTSSYIISSFDYLPFINYKSND